MSDVLETIGAIVLIILLLVFLAIMVTSAFLFLGIFFIIGSIISIPFVIAAWIGSFFAPRGTDHVNQ